ncbi:F-box domain-containing protein [Mycena indigotica]|uniref:F-box domain-containing protein n=1 Tax=Mycena indigotica TaxID=2126181 RepID=A0A8H6RXV2_9AGAR|nr:F-box domain-containing protein [Mycena indigotica]KAF7288877.1 F-box domain-containing protein [Mycena indigotica]
MLGFDDLPSEMVALILAHTHPRQLVACRLVCRLWHDVIDGMPALQYKTELWRDGLLEGNSHGLRPDECLARLRVRREAWNSLRWSEKYTAPMENPEDCRAFEMFGGVFGLQESDAGQLQVVTLPRLADSGHTDGTAGNALWTGSVHLPGHVVEDFAIDVAEDLIAILHIDGDQEGFGTLALRSLTLPNFAHPEAARPEIRFVCDDYEVEDMTMQVVDDVVAVILLSTQRLVLFDWRNGECVLDWDFAFLRAIECHLLAPRLLLLVCRPAPNSGDSDSTVNLPTPPSDIDDDGCLQIHVLPDILGLDIAAPMRVATLHLPPLSTDQIQLSTASLFAGAYAARPPPQAPFYQANDRRVVSFVIRYSPGGRMRLVFHIHTVLRLVKAWRTDGQVRELQWNAWGPKETRMWVGSLDAVGLFWPRHVHGERLIMPTASRRAIRILDFNLPPTSTAPVGEDGTITAAQTSAEGAQVSKLKYVLSVDVQGEEEEIPVDDIEPDCNVLHFQTSDCQMKAVATVYVPIAEAADWGNERSGDLSLRDMERTLDIGVFQHAMHTSLPYREIRRVIRPHGTRLPGEAQTGNSGVDEEEWVDKRDAPRYGMAVMDEQWIVAADTENDSTNNHDMVFLKMG